MERTNAITPFLMESEARAKAVALSLRDIMARRNQVVSLKRCQAAVAAMYGYADWAALRKAIGSGHSLDDSAVDLGELASRAAAQRAALVALGVPASEVEAVRMWLSPTGRGEADAIATPVVQVFCDLHYHPVKHRMRMGALEKMFHEMQAEDMGWDVFGSDFDHAVIDIVKTFAQQHGATPLDCRMVKTDSYEALCDDVSKVLDETRFIIDASSKPDGSNPAEVLDADLDLSVIGEKTIYVHLGVNAFPSPFPGCGVEGCYFDFDPGRDDDNFSGTLQATFVVSQEYAAGADTMEIGDTPMQDALFSFRAVSYCHCWEREEEEKGRRTLRLVIGKDNIEYSDHETWADYLEAPLAAAWRAAAAARTGIDVVDGVPHEGGDELVRRWQRAKSPARREAILQELCDSDEVLVRFVGGIPPVAVTGESPSFAIARFPIPNVGDPEIWASSYTRQSSKACLPEMALMYADMSLAVLQLPAAAMKTGRHLDMSHALRSRSDALADLGRLDEAVAALGDAVMFWPRHHSSDVFFRQMALHVRRGDVDEARRALADIHPSDKLIWAKPLFEARFGDAEKAAALLSIAAKASPSIMKLLESWHPPMRQLRWCSVDSDESHDHQIASYQYDAWRSLPNFSKLFLEAKLDVPAEI